MLRYQQDKVIDIADDVRLTEVATKPTANFNVEFLCVSLDKYSKLTQFFTLSSGVFAFYLLYGYFQELIFRFDGFKPYGWYLTLVQFALYTVFGWTESRSRGDTIRKVPWKWYFVISVLTVGTMTLSNSSVGYLNYPTQVMFKCCKLIPVLIGGIIIQGKSQTVMDFISAALMSLGLIFFTLADVEVSPNFDPVGVVMISLALVADAAIGNVQEKVMKQTEASNTEVVLYSYGIGFLMLLSGAVISGQIPDAVLFCSRNPLEIYGSIVVFSITGYMGVQLVLALIKCSGAFVAVTVTTCRKAVTIILSFVFFTKPFTIQYIWSGFLVIAGIFLNVIAKRSSSTGQSWNIFERIVRNIRSSIRVSRTAQTTLHL